MTSLAHTLPYTYACMCRVCDLYVPSICSVCPVHMQCCAFSVHFPCRCCAYTLRVPCMYLVSTWLHIAFSCELAMCVACAVNNTSCNCAPEPSWENTTRDLDSFTWSHQRERLKIRRGSRSRSSSGSWMTDSEIGRKHFFFRKGSGNGEQRVHKVVGKRKESEIRDRQ